MNVILHKNSTSFKFLLYLAGFYHLLLGLSIVLFPSFFFHFSNLPVPEYIELWQAVGLYTALLGTGYLLSSSNAIRHWRIVLLGFANKCILLLWFFGNFIQHKPDSVLFSMLLVNHLIWIFPFGIILFNAYKQQFVLDNELIKMNHVSTDELLNIFVTNKHHTVTELADKQPVMLVFLRHFGCTFCKEALMNIKKLRLKIEQQGTKIVLVTMVEEKQSLEELQRYNLADVEYISDTESLLYKAFKLRRGTFTQLFGWKVIVHSIRLLFTKGLFLSSPQGADIYQMPGIFVIYKGSVMKQFIHKSVADEAPLLELAALNTASR
jgi:peroxiredoxin